MASTHTKLICVVCKNPVVKKYVTCSNCDQFVHRGCTRRKCCDKPSFFKAGRYPSDGDDDDGPSDSADGDGETNSYRGLPTLNHNLNGKTDGETSNGITVDVSLLTDIFAKLSLLTAAIDEIKATLADVLEQNRDLKKQLSHVKEDNVVKSTNKNNDTTFASVVNNINKNKVFLINPKLNSPQSTAKPNKLSDDIKKKVSPTKLGVGVSIAGTTRQGALVLQCNSSKNVDEIQGALQRDIGEEYTITRPRSWRKRIKMFRINSSEHEVPDDVLVRKIIKQNDLEDGTSEIKVISRTKIIDGKFNLVLETDDNTFRLLAGKDKINIGWNRSPFTQDFGILRCYNCSQYGHTASKCKNSLTCPTCSGEHKLSECSATAEKKCVNCHLANIKYKINLDVNHVVWDKSCKSLSRITDFLKDKHNSA